jgi:hypothetical protein
MRVDNDRFSRAKVASRRQRRKPPGQVSFASQVTTAAAAAPGGPPSAAGAAPKNGHDCRNSRKICRRTLANAEARDIISRFTVPNSNAGLPSGEGDQVVDYAGIPGGVVCTTFSSDGLAGGNVTTPAHALVGTVDQTIVRRGRSSYLNTHGYGSAGINWFGRLRDGQNDSWGPVIFDNVASKAALYAAARYRGC